MVGSRRRHAVAPLSNELDGKGDLIENPVTTRRTTAMHEKYVVVKLDPAIGQRLKVQAALTGRQMREIAMEILDQNLQVQPPRRPDDPTIATRAAPKRQPAQVHRTRSR
jgi:plasmid stability protein